MLKTRLMMNTLGAAAVLAALGTITAPAIADDYQAPYTESAYDDQAQHVDIRPLTVWIDVEKGRSNFGKNRGKGKGKHGRRNSHRGDYRQSTFETMVRSSLAQQLPAGAVMARSPYRADLRLTVVERDYEVDFRTLNIKQKDKAYKWSAREGRGPCGRLNRAIYDHVKDQATANYRFGMRIDGRFNYFQRERISGYDTETFKYGRNLRAMTPCGVKPVSTFPTAKVRRRFEQADPSYTKQVRRELRADVARDVAREAAAEVYEYAPLFQDRMIAEAAYRAGRDYAYNRSDRHDSDYRYDH